jgi:hypothetical protein
MLLLDAFRFLHAGYIKSKLKFVYNYCGAYSTNSLSGNSALAVHFVQSLQRREKYVVLDVHSLFVHFARKMQANYAQQFFTVIAGMRVTVRKIEQKNCTKPTRIPCLLPCAVISES